MKPSSLFFIALSVCCIATRAQAQSLELGVHAGVTISNAATEENIMATARQGVILGASASFTLAPPLRLQVEAQYTKKGIEIGTTGPSASPGDIYNLSYLEIPVNIRFDIGSQAFGVYALAGTNIGTLLSASREYNRSQDNTGENSQINEFLTPMNMALELGGGVGIGLGGGATLFADARYSFGLVEISDGDQSVLNRNSWTPRDLKVVSGVRFRL